MGRKSKRDKKGDKKDKKKRSSSVKNGSVKDTSTVPKRASSVPAPPDHVKANRSSSGMAIARALFDFDTEARKELAIRSGQLVEIVNDGDGEKMWWLVRNESGATGFVPSNYLTVDPRLTRPDGAPDECSNPLSNPTTPEKMSPPKKKVVDINEVLQRKLHNGIISKEEHDKIIVTARLAEEQLLLEEAEAKAERERERAMKKRRDTRPTITVIRPNEANTNNTTASIAPTPTTPPVIQRDNSTDDQAVQDAIAEAKRLTAALSEEDALIHKKRTMIFNEIVSTEEKYVETLAMLVNLFVKPLRKAATNASEHQEYFSGLFGPSLEFTKEGDPRVVIEKQQVKVIFLEIESLYAINAMFLERLKAKQQTWGPSCKVGDVFMSMMNFFKSYTTFATNFENAMNTIVVCKKQPTFALYLKHCKETKPECEKLWLQDHMTTPIQRIPRYIMLLRDLLKKTPEGHDDYPTLGESLDAMEKIARIVNDAKNTADNNMKLLEIQSTVKRCPQIVGAARRYVGEVQCCEVVPENPRKAKKILDSESGFPSHRAGSGVKRRASYSGNMSRRGSAPSWVGDMQNIREEEVEEEEMEPEESETMPVEGISDEKGGLHPEKDDCPFQDSGTVAIYLLNDVILIAKHERVSTAWGRATENMKSIKGAILLEEKRKYSITKEDGKETLNKFKFQRLEDLSTTSISEFPDDEVLPNGFVLHFPNGPVYYQANSPEERESFLEGFNQASDQLYETQHQRLNVLQRRFGSVDLSAVSAAANEATRST